MSVILVIEDNVKKKREGNERRKWKEVEDWTKREDSKAHGIGKTKIVV
jgi:hypothetical protein